MRAWINGDLLSDATGSGGRRSPTTGSPWGTGCSRRSRSSTGCRSPSTCTSRGCTARLRALGLPERRRGRRTPGDRGRARRRRRCRWAGSGSPYTGGPAPLGSGRGDAPPTLVVVADAMKPWPETDRGGDRAVAAQRARRAGRAQDHVVRRERRRARRRRRQQGASEAIFANLAGHLCEGTGSNVFYVVDGELRTPTLASGCLAGVTRALILEWYGGREVDEPIEVVERASEVFLASTTRDVQAVARWDGRELAAPGPVTAEVAGAVARSGSRSYWASEPGERRRPAGRGRSTRCPAGTSARVRVRNRHEVAGRQLGDQPAVGGAELHDDRGAAVLVDARPQLDVALADRVGHAPGAAGRGRPASGPVVGGRRR